MGGGQVTCAANWSQKPRIESGASDLRISILSLLKRCSWPTVTMIVTVGAVLGWCGPGFGSGTSVTADSPAHASGPCLFQGDWNCYGPPQWNGQLQPTWEVPPYTWPNNRLQCDPSAYACYPVVRP